MEGYGVDSIVIGVVSKNLPDAECYLVQVFVNGNRDAGRVFAQLPKQNAVKQYRIGESLLAAVESIRGARITLTQRNEVFSFFERTLSFKKGSN
ncbi:hypothetical protein [Thermodesulfovibrio hydrogeniphilus]